MYQVMLRLSKCRLLILFVIVFGCVLLLVTKQSRRFDNYFKEYVKTQLDGLQVYISKEMIKTRSDIAENRNALMENKNEILTNNFKMNVLMEAFEKNKPNIKLLNARDIVPFHGEILIMVTSQIAYTNRRSSIRSHWGDSKKFLKHRQKYNSVDYKVYFMTGFRKEHMGRARAESIRFKDMLITNRTEHYFDLSRRVMLGFLWSLQHCSYDYLLKADDDVFVNIPNLFKLVYTDPFVLEHADRLYAGFIKLNMTVNRDPNSKWYISQKEWPLKSFPLYSSGMGYVLSRLLVKRMHPHFDWVNPFKLDDVYVGMLLNAANVPRVGIRVVPKDEIEFLPNEKVYTCNFSPVAIIHHKVINDKCMEKLTIRSSMQPN